MSSIVRAMIIGNSILDEPVLQLLLVQLFGCESFSKHGVWQAISRQRIFISNWHFRVMGVLVSSPKNEDSSSPAGPITAQLTDNDALRDQIQMDHPDFDQHNTAVDVGVVPRDEVTIVINRALQVKISLIVIRESIYISQTSGP